MLTLIGAHPHPMPMSLGEPQVLTTRYIADPVLVPIPRCSARLL